MKRFVQGADRTQSILLPEQLDDYVSEDNPVRAVDVFVDSLDLATLGFEGVNPAQTGRSSYHPSILLKIYIYGYLNRVQSSRRLEREAQRNVELMWLTSRLTPDFKTIADFRRDNGTAILNVCRQFLLICQKLNLFSDAVVAIDGSKFKAVNTRDKDFTDKKLKARIEQLEESISRYLAELDRADRQPTLVPESRVVRLRERIASLKEQVKGFNELNKQLQRAPDRQISLTDPDARAMATSGRGTGIVGYNVQTAVDAKHHLIVAHEVTNVGHDRTQLASMAAQASEAIKATDLTVIADRGYFSSQEILACEQQGMTPLVPKPLTSNSKAEGRFDKGDFIYIAQSDEYQCPAGQRAIWRFSTVEQGLTQHKYWSSACPQCPIKALCTTSSYRRIGRWEHEEVLDRMQKRLNEWPDTARLRRQTVEHPFGTLKAWMGATHFAMKTLPRVKTEMSLHVLAYNFKRVMQIIGFQSMISALAR